MKRKAWGSTAAWLFGISVTVLFVALWGRAIVIDTETLGDSLAPLGESGAVINLLTDWATGEFVDAGVDPALIEPTIDYVLESTDVGSTLGQLVSEIVVAAASSHPGGSSVDMSALLLPVASEIAFGLQQVGVATSTAEVEQIVRDLDPLVVREPGTTAMVGAASPAASRLGLATLLASLGIVIFGYSVVAVSDDRVVAFRGLLTRVAVSGFTFAILLRVGSWVLDPNGGRAPIPDALSHLASSKWLIPLQVATVAALIAGAIYLIRRWLTRGEVSPEPVVSPIPQPEQPLSLSGLR